MRGDTTNAFNLDSWSAPTAALALQSKFQAEPETKTVAYETEQAGSPEESGHTIGGFPRTEPLRRFTARQATFCSRCAQGNGPEGREGALGRLGTQENAMTVGTPLYNSHLQVIFASEGLNNG